MVPLLFVYTHRLPLAELQHRPMHEEPSRYRDIGEEMPSLGLGWLAPVISKQDAIDVDEGVLASADVAADIETWVAIAAVFPVDEVDFLIIDEEIYVACVSVDVAFAYAVTFCELGKLVDASAYFLEFGEAAVSGRWDLVFDAFGFFDDVEVPSHARWCFVQSTKQHHCSNHVVEVAVIEVAVLHEPADSPALVDVHGHKRCIDAGFFDDFLHDGLASAFNECFRTQPRVAIYVLSAVELEGKHYVGHAGLDGYKLFYIACHAREHLADVLYDDFAAFVREETTSCLYVSQTQPSNLFAYVVVECLCFARSHPSNSKKSSGSVSLTFMVELFENHTRSPSASMSGTVCGSTLSSKPRLRP